MATPIIDSVTATPSTVAPGGAFVVTVVAHDPDSRTARLTASVTDSQGNPVAQDVSITISDALTYELLDRDAIGFQITPRAGQPGVFDVIAP